MAMRFRRHQEAAHDSTRRLLALFVVVLLLLVLAVNGALALVYRLMLPFTSGYPAYFFETNTVVVLAIVLGGCWFEQWRLQEGGAHVARLAGGLAARGEHGAARGPLEQRLLNLVQEMALASRSTAPAAWVLPREGSINAFAAGWDADDAVVAVTRGALERLTREELQGVVAHEFSHLVHGDTRLNMRLIGLVWGLEMVFGFGRRLAQRDELGRYPPGALFGVALMAVGSLGWLAGRLLQAAVSRQREFLADASAVQYTRNVAGLGNALRKIEGQARRGTAATHSPTLQAPHVAAFSHLLLDVRPGWSLWATHPPLAERIQRLYGRTLPPLDAPELPAGPAEAEFVPPAGALGLQAGAAVPPAAPAAPEADRHDATQRLDHFDAAEREREALVRIERWNGPAERRAALLGLLVEADDPERMAVWRAAVAGLPRAAAIGRDLATLGVDARRATFEALARRSAATLPTERRALRTEAAALARGPLETLRALALRHLLDTRPRPWLPPTPERSIAGRWADVAGASLALGRVLRGDALAAHDWRATVLGLLAPHAPPQPAVPARLPSAWATARAVVGCSRRLAGLQRPVLVRAWVDACQPLRPPDTRIAEALHWACLLLDTPLPPPPEARWPGAAPAQERSL
jgi:Zn-dependent protease with chaperone function